MSLFDVAKQKIKEKTKSAIKLYITLSDSDLDKIEWVKLSDVLAVLGDLQKANLLASKEKLRKLLIRFEKNATYYDVETELLEDVFGAETLEKLLGDNTLPIVKQR